MKKYYGHRITKRERAAVDMLYGSRCGDTVNAGIGHNCICRLPARHTGAHNCLCGDIWNYSRSNNRQTPLPGLATK